MSDQPGNTPIAEPINRTQRPTTSEATSLIVGRATQPSGFLDTSKARVPGFEEITDQPDWGGHGFSGRKSDMRVVRFDRQPAAEEQAES